MLFVYTVIIKFIEREDMLHYNPNYYVPKNQKLTCFDF